MINMKKKITKRLLEGYKKYLYEQEKSQATIDKYMCDLKKLTKFVDNRELNKMLIIEYKTFLKEMKYKTSSINSYLVAANRFFDYIGRHDLKVKTYSVQKKIFIPENKELSREEYRRLVNTANQQGKKRMALILQTICATGIRVSELSMITVSAVKSGVVTIYSKGKERQIIILRDLQLRLLMYINRSKIKHGSIFQTKSGKPVDRTWIWREMKKLCEKADVEKDKVFPHNLRHLFARTFYSIYKDIAKLADILGHSSIETTRIYLRENYFKYRKQIEQLNLLIE